MFAIQGALKLGKAAQQAYVDSTRNRGLILPTPEFNPDVNATVAANYFFHEDPNYRPLEREKFEELMRLTNPDIDAELNEAQKRQLVEFYFEARMADPVTREFITSSTDGSFFTEDSLKSIVEIRQWERGADGVVTPLQRVAGTIVEIAVDYYSSTPGALNNKSSQGKSLRVLLTALDDIEFSTVPIHDLPERLVVATIESLSQHSDILSGDKNTQELIKVTATALAGDVKTRIEVIRANRPSGNAEQEQRIVNWAEVVFRSVLSSGGKLVANDPKRFLGVDNQETETLVKHVGIAALDFVLSQPEGSIARAFGREGLDVVVRATFRLVGEHPEILTDTNNEGLKGLLSNLATELSQFDALVAPGALPEVVRIILEKSGQNLPLIWPDTGDPGRHLLIASVSKTLAILTNVPNGASWRAKFGKAQLLEVLEFTLDEFVKNPGWMIDAAGQHSGSLEIAMEAIVDVLRTRADDRLSPETGLAILRSSLRAVGKHKKLIEQLEDGKLAISSLIDTSISKIFDQALDEAVSWAIIRQDVITVVIDSALEAIGKTSVSQQHLDDFAALLDAELIRLANGDPLNLELLKQTIEQTITATP
jgi:hypothetical protein